MRVKLRICLLFACAWMGISPVALGAFPEKPITLVVPWAAGGSTDILARALADQWSKQFGQVVIVDNRPGASGNIGSAFVARATPDGYTLLVGSMSTHAMNPALMPSMPFRGVEDFTPIAKLADVINTMVVHPSVPVNTVAEFIAYAKANPGKLNYASAGVGSTNYLSAVMFANATGVDMVHVPYKGGAPAVQDTAVGHTHLMFTAATQSLPQVHAGRLNMLAVTEAKRSALLPGIPTVAETVPGYEMGVWYGLFGPADMPQELVERLNAAANQAMSNPVVRARMENMGVELTYATPEEFAAILHADAQRYGTIIRDLGIRNE